MNKADERKRGCKIGIYAEVPTPQKSFPKKIEAIMIEKAEIWITCEKVLYLNDGRAIRGFFGNLYRNRPEFHGHIGDRLIYKHPLIQYKVFGGSALIIGLKEGAYLLKALPEIEYLEVYYQRYPIIKQNTSNASVPFGITEGTVCYTFVTPWIGLNEKNYHLYLELKKGEKDTRVLLDKILIGNILSMGKSVGYTVNNTLLVKSKLVETQGVEVKKDVQLTAFEGEFETNFLMPDFWGIGGKVSLGYGTVKRKEGGET